MKIVGNTRLRDLPLSCGLFVYCIVPAAIAGCLVALFHDRASLGWRSLGLAG
jgi:hypothetical protein